MELPLAVGSSSSLVALRRRTDLAVANTIGSNVVNILGILGATALVTPLTASPAIVATDVWWMLGISLLVYPMMGARGRIVRAEGAVPFGAHVGYMVVLLRGGGG